VIGGIVAAAIFYFILSGAPTGKWNDFIAIWNMYGGERPIGAEIAGAVFAVATRAET